MNSVAPITSLAETLYEYCEELEEANTELDQEIIENTIKGLDIIKQRGEGCITFVDSYRKLTKVSIPNKKALQAMSDPVDGRVILDAFIDHDRITITVKDNGLGISNEVKD
jgi:two-component system nitrogen regulation sensor histidine kinase NtrY